MPTPLPSSFASAAAGNAHDASKRGDVSASGEWYALFLSGSDSFGSLGWISFT